jgi:anion transporter
VQQRAAKALQPLSRATASSRWLKFALAATVGMLVHFMPAPQGLSHAAQTVLAILAFAVALWMLQVMNNGVASILMMGLLIPAGVKPSLALSGFATPGFWILLVVLFYGCAMQRTGLAKRISFYLLSLFPGTYAGLMTAFFVIGTVLALGIPSMTVRTAIMTPIAWALVQSLGLAPRSRGAALIMLTTVEMAVLPGTEVLYGSLLGPVLVSAFQIKHLPLTWLGYAQVLALPTVLICVLVLVVNYFVLRPESSLRANPDFVRSTLRAMGPIGGAELITAVVVVISIVFWATDRIHQLPAFFIGMLALAVFALTGIIRDQDIGSGISWTLILFLGGIFGLGNVIQEYKLTDWLAGYFVPVAGQLAFSTVVLLVVIVLAMYALRFLDPTGFIAIPVLFLPLSELAHPDAMDPRILAAPMLLASSPFWLSYQNIWIAMGEEITGGQAFSSKQRIQLATVYGLATVVVVVLSVGYWKLIGLL